MQIEKIHLEIKETMFCFTASSNASLAPGMKELVTGPFVGVPETLPLELRSDRNYSGNCLIVLSAFLLSLLRSGTNDPLRTDFMTSLYFPP